MDYSVDVPRKFRPLVSPELRPNERIVWIGQPIPWRFVKRFIGAFLFGILWSGFLGFWANGLVRNMLAEKEPGWGALAFFAAFLIPFSLMGVVLLSWPFWSWRKAKRTIYVLTDQRAVVFDANWWQAVTIRSFEPSRLTDVRRVQNADGSGDLEFERTVKTDGEGSLQATDHGFMSIPGVKAVEDAIRQLVAQAASAAERS